MGHVTKYETKGGTRWRARYRVAGREVSRSFKRKHDAEVWLTTQVADRVRGDWADPRAGRLLYGEWLARWLASRRGRPSTRARDEAYARNQLAPHWQGWRLADIGQPDVVAWVAALEAKGLAPATVTKAYQLFAASMAAAVDAELIAKTPARGVPMRRVERDEMRFLTPSEVAALAEVIDERYRALVLVGAYGGLRISELAGLRSTDVDLLRATVAVEQQCVWVRGHPLFGPPKTRAGRRRVVLPRTVADELGRHMQNRKSAEMHMAGKATHGADLVFPSPDGAALQPTNFRRRIWRPAVEAAGLAPLRVHDLRHTAVSMWIAAGADPKTVAVRAGHTSVVTVLNVYGHLYPDRDAALADRLEEMAASARRTGQVSPLRPRERDAR